MRTWLPTISITWMEMSSPSTIFSPGRRVMISTRPAYPSGGLLLLPREQRRAHGRVVDLVDDLVAAALVDHDRRAQVRRELLQPAGGAHGDPHGDVLARLGQAGGGGGVVGQLEAEVAEELPRVGDRQRQVRVLGGLQPAERAVCVGGDDN